MNVQTTASAASPAQTVRQAPPPAFDPSDELLTVLEAASCLKVCRRTVYNLLTAGTLRAFYVGKQRRIPRGELLKYLGGDSAVDSTVNSAVNSTVEAAGDVGGIGDIVVGAVHE